MMDRTPIAQRVLRVDLAARTTELTDIPTSDIVRFLGGRGEAAAILARAVDGPIDPFSTEAPIIFSMGTLTGTNAPMSGRSTVTFVSPATGLYFKANVGGHFGLYCKLNGIDYIDIRGAATSPVYLWIDGHTAELLPATDIWGKTVREATRSLQAIHGDDINVACIGPAGENRVLFAAIMSSVYNAAARGGGGALMGSKGLKAIAVARPRGAVVPVDPDAFRDVCEEMRAALYDDSMADSYYRLGTAASIGPMNELNTLPSYNFQRGSIDEIKELTSEYWNERGLLKGRIGCASCIYSCHRFIRIEEGAYQGTYSAGPEYETVSALGSGPAVPSIGAVQRANELCNDLGLDTISTGGAIQWAMETSERGCLPDEFQPDFAVRFGNEEAIIQLPRLIAYREGIGALLADGVKRAAERIGGETWKWAIHTRGLEQSRVETRGALGYALAFAMNPRGPDHLHTECLAEFGMTQEMRDLVEQITGDARYARPDIPEKRPEIVRWHEDIYAVSDSLGLCAFVTTAAYGASPARCARLFSSLTGIQMNGEEIMHAGRRIITLERLLNLRLGWRNEAKEFAPWRLMNERQASLETEPMLSRELMAEMVQGYYRLHGWDVETGIPLPETLRSLELEDFTSV